MLDARFARSRRKRSPATLSKLPSRAFWLPALALAATLSVASAARATDYELSRMKPAALSLELGGAALLGGMALFLPTPEQCRWCNPPGFDEALARPVAPEDRKIPGRVSHMFSYGVIPAVAISALLVPPFTTSEPNVHAYQNLMLATEVVMVDLALTLAFKMWIARRRPAFYYARTAYTEYAVDSREANVSFFSGDTSAAFAAASAAATISFQRGYRSAPYVTATGATLALATGLLRVGADVHWASDVLTGALVGAGLGIAMPLLLHPRLTTSSEARASASTTLAPVVPADTPLLRFSGAFLSL